MGTTSGAVTMYPFGVHEFTHPYTHTFKWGSHSSFFSFVVHFSFGYCIACPSIYGFRLSLGIVKHFVHTIFVYNFGLHILIEIML